MPKAPWRFDSFAPSAMDKRNVSKNWFASPWTDKSYVGERHYWDGHHPGSRVWSPCRDHQQQRRACRLVTHQFKNNHVIKNTVLNGNISLNSVTNGCATIFWHLHSNNSGCLIWCFGCATVPPGRTHGVTVLLTGCTNQLIHRNSKTFVGRASAISARATSAWRRLCADWLTAGSSPARPN